MSELVPCYLESHVAVELRRLAVLAGSESTAIERLIAFWNANQPNAGAGRATDEAKPAAKWRSRTGDELRVGAKLEANYRGRTYCATVEQQGIRFGKSLYQTPSAAGRAVKQSVGVTGAAGQTDGRSFWGMRDPSTGRLVSIGQLNPREIIDTAALLRELDDDVSTQRGA